MIVLYSIAVFLIGIYFLFILSFIIGFDKVKGTCVETDENTCFSIVIPFRNEAKRLPLLLDSIKKIVYPTTHFEVVFVNDDSTDASVKIIKDFCAENTLLSIQIIDAVRSSNSPKKDAITTAIHNTKYEWIVCTDADCVLPNSWLTSFNGFIVENNPNMIVAPVSFTSDTSFLAQFQLIDFLSMQGATIGGFGIQQPFMANGANLAYKKELFLTLKGFDDNNFIASGDDVFLLENFIKYNKSKVLFLKEHDALVTTFPVKNWETLISQRKRWAAKATHFKLNFTKGVGLLVFFTNLTCALALVLVFFDFSFIGILILKFFIDTLLIYKTARLYKQRIKLIQYLKTLLFYPFFTAFIAVFSMLGSFEWKGRSFKK